MSKGVNKVILIGNCGQNPIANKTANGVSVVKLSIATSESWKDSNGQQQERTEWHNVVFFNKLADIVNQYVRKGSKIYAEGTLKTSTYEKDGITRYSTDIICNNMQMLDSKLSQPASATIQNDDIPF
tara:strand:+ start:218 stop:598 length:381 start_codon:yes stop_codon:yes gene_type:complete